MSLKNDNRLSVAVAPVSFSRNEALRRSLSCHFRDVAFNTEGRLEGGRLVQFLKGHTAAIIGMERISEELLEELPHLRVISKYGVGLDNIDRALLEKCGIHLGYSAGTNAQSVAELTLCFMLSLMRRVFQCAENMRAGSWRKDEGRQLFEKTVGIIGCGNIGKAVVRLLQPFRCRIMVNDILAYDDFYREYRVETGSFERVMRESDIVSLHVPLTDLTRHMVNARSLALMKKEAMLVNTSRGDVVNLVDLKQVLSSGRISGAALDVFNPEPFEDRELLQLRNLIATPHVGGTADEAVLAMGNCAIKHLVEYFSVNGLSA